MASTNKTTNYELSQFQSSDIPAWLTDYNGDMQKIDTGIHAAKSQASGAASGVSALQTAVSGKQDRLTFDTAPLADSANPVTSGGIYNALQNVTVQTDAVPTPGSSKAVQSGGVYTALQGKQDKLTFDNVPRAGSTNPVTSGGVFSAIANQSGGWRRVVLKDISLDASAGSAISETQSIDIELPEILDFNNHTYEFKFEIFGLCVANSTSATVPTVATIRFRDGNGYVGGSRIMPTNGLSNFPSHTTIYQPSSKANYNYIIGIIAKAGSPLTTELVNQAQSSANFVNDSGEASIIRLTLNSPASSSSATNYCFGIVFEYRMID